MTNHALLRLLCRAGRSTRFASVTTADGTAVQQAYPPGVNADGILVDPQAYFFWLIQRSPGQSAADWVTVLSYSGIPEGYAAGVKPVWNDVYGLTQQWGSEGPRGRIFLPTAVPDDLGYYSHPFDCLADGPTAGSLVWAWVDKGGPPYVPVTPGGGQVPVPDEGLTAEEVQAMIDASIAKAMEGKTGVQFGDKIALRTNSGLLAGIAGGGPTVSDAPIAWIGKTDAPHAWESFELVKGE